MKKSNFNKLLERYLTGQATPQEKVRIETWLEVMKDQKLEDDFKFTEAEEEKFYRKITSEINHRETSSAIPAEGKQRWFESRAFRIAATVLFLALTSYSVWWIMRDNNFTETTAANEEKKTILEDGTIVWLKGGSKITYNLTDEGIRHAEFSGIALFEVAKDADHPFIVQCEQATIRVLGTSFSVKAIANDVELNVLTGKVNLSSEQNKTGINLEPNDKGVCTSNGPVSRLTSGENEVAVLIANTEYNMQFTNDPLDKVVERISQKFNVRITFSNAAMKSCRITADFTDFSLESTLRMITEVMGTDIEKSGGTYTVRGNSCR